MSTEEIALIEKPILAILGGFATLLFFIVGYIWNRNVKKLDKLAVDVEAYKLIVAKDYATKGDLKELKEGLFDRWDKMESKIDDCLRLISSGVVRGEFETLKDQLHERINSLAKSKLDK